MIRHQHRRKGGKAMKKVLAIILCGVMLAALCACANTSAADNVTEPTVEQQEETKSYIGGNEGSRGENPIRPEYSYR